jgi:hypothetical protein
MFLSVLLHLDVVSNRSLVLGSGLSCKSPHFLVEPRGFEPLTSAVQKRQDRLPEVSGACKIPAKTPYLHVGTFLKISGYVLRLLHGCCTDTVRREIVSLGGKIYDTCYS